MEKSTKPAPKKKHPLSLFRYSCAPKPLIAPMGIM